MTTHPIPPVSHLQVLAMTVAAGIVALFVLAHRHDRAEDRKKFAVEFHPWATSIRGGPKARLARERRPPKPMRIARKWLAFTAWVDAQLERGGSWIEEAQEPFDAFKEWES
jgi:hypothetical protein